MDQKDIDDYNAGAMGNPFASGYGQSAYAATRKGTAAGPVKQLSGRAVLVLLLLAGLAGIVWNTSGLSAAALGIFDATVAWVAGWMGQPPDDGIGPVVLVILLGYFMAALFIANLFLRLCEAVLRRAWPVVGLAALAYFCYMYLMP